MDKCGGSLWSGIFMILDEEELWAFMFTAINLSVYKRWISLLLSRQLASKYTFSSTELLNFGDEVLLFLSGIFRWYDVTVVYALRMPMCRCICNLEEKAYVLNYLFPAILRWFFPVVTKHHKNSVNIFRLKKLKIRT